MRTEFDLYGMVHVKVDFIPVLKMCVLTILGKFVWTTIFDNVEGYIESPFGPVFFKAHLHALMSQRGKMLWIKEDENLRQQNIYSALFAKNGSCQKNENQRKDEHRPKARHNWNKQMF